MRDMALDAQVVGIQPIQGLKGRAPRDTMCRKHIRWPVNGSQFATRVPVQKRSSKFANICHVRSTDFAVRHLQVRFHFTRLIAIAHCWFKTRCMPGTLGQLARPLDSHAVGLRLRRRLKRTTVLLLRVNTHLLRCCLPPCCRKTSRGQRMSPWSVERKPRLLRPLLLRCYPSPSRRWCLLPVGLPR